MPDVPRDPLTPPAEIAWRTARAQAAMQAGSLDALFVAQNADLYYFAGTVQDGLLAVPAAGEPTFLVRRALERARAETPLRRVAPARSAREYPDLLAAQGIGPLRRVGLEMDVLPAGLYFRLARAFPGVEFVDASDLIRTVRAVKRPWEVEQMRRAAEVQDCMVRRLREVLRPGLTELDLAVEMDAAGRRAGHQGLVRFRRFNQEVFVGHVLAGETAGMPTFMDSPTGGLGPGPAFGTGASRRPVRRDEPVLFDYNSCYNGYHSDQTRTLVVGRLPDDMAAAHEACREILGAAGRWLRPGVAAGEVYARCVTLAERLGLADGFMGHGTARVPYVGHGVGVEMDELPVLARGVATVLEAGMTVAVEPKVGFPGRGMVGVEDLFLVGGAEATPLNITPRDLIVV